MSPVSRKNVVRQGWRHPSAGRDPSSCPSFQRSQLGPRLSYQNEPGRQTPLDSRVRRNDETGPTARDSIIVDAGDDHGATVDAPFSGRTRSCHGGLSRHRARACLMGRARLRRGPGQDAARRSHERRDELRSVVLRRRGLRWHHRPHLRIDARLRLPRPTGEPGAGDATSCSSSTGRTSARRTTRGSACPSTTSSSMPRESCPIHRSAPPSSTG